MDWLSNPWITTMQGELLYTRDLVSKTMPKPLKHCSTKFTQIKERNCAADDSIHFGLMPRSETKAQADNTLFEED